MTPGEPFRADHGFACAYYPTIQDGPVFRWTRGEQLEISASRRCVMLDAKCIPVSSADIWRLQMVLETARNVREQLLSRIEPDRVIFTAGEDWQSEAKAQGVIRS